MGQAVGLAIQLAVTQGLSIEFHRHRVRGFPGAITDQFVYQPLGREAGIGLVPQFKDLLLFVLAQ